MFPSIHNEYTAVRDFYHDIENLGDICSPQSLRIVGIKRSVQGQIAELHTQIIVISQIDARVPQRNQRLKINSNNVLCGDVLQPGDLQRMLS